MGSRCLEWRQDKLTSAESLLLSGLCDCRTCSQGTKSVFPVPVGTSALLRQIRGRSMHATFMHVATAQGGWLTVQWVCQEQASWWLLVSLC